jgi:hypothetical protein
MQYSETRVQNVSLVDNFTLLSEDSGNSELKGLGGAIDAKKIPHTIERLNIFMPRVLDNQPDILLSSKLDAGHDIGCLAGVDRIRYKVSERAGFAIQLKWLARVVVKRRRHE